MSVLSGSLESFALPDIFRLMAWNKQTGGLKIARESGEGTIYFRDGEVYFASSSLTREFLGQRLVNAKLITQGQLLRILDEQKRTGTGRLGELLVDKGVISKELLDTFIKEQIQDAIFNLLQWDIGGFSFDEGETSPQEIGLSVSVENLIMESSRRLEEWEVIRRKLPSLDVVVRMSPTPPDDSVEINIKPDEWTLLVLADGVRSVRDIAAATERSEFDACKIIYGLVTAGLLDVSSGRVVPSNEEPSRMSPSDLDQLHAARAEEPAREPVPQVQTPPDEREIPRVRVHEPVIAEALAEAEEESGQEPARLDEAVVVAERAPAEEQTVAAAIVVPEEDTFDATPAEEPSMAAAQIAAISAHDPANDQEHEQNGNGNGNGVSTIAGQNEISKDTLLRLIAGVRGL